MFGKYKNDGFYLFHTKVEVKGLIMNYEILKKNYFYYVSGFKGFILITDIKKLLISLNNPLESLHCCLCSRTLPSLRVCLSSVFVLLHVSRFFSVSCLPLSLTIILC